LQRARGWGQRSGIAPPIVRAAAAAAAAMMVTAAEVTQVALPSQAAVYRCVAQPWVAQRCRPARWTIRGCPVVTVRPSSTAELPRPLRVENVARGRTAAGPALAIPAGAAGTAASAVMGQTHQLQLHRPSTCVLPTVTGWSVASMENARTPPPVWGFVSAMMATVACIARWLIPAFIGAVTAMACVLYKMQRRRASAAAATVENTAKRALARPFSVAIMACAWLMVTTQLTTVHRMPLSLPRSLEEELAVTATESSTVSVASMDRATAKTVEPARVWCVDRNRRHGVCVAVRAAGMGRGASSAPVKATSVARHLEPDAALWWIIRRCACAWRNTTGGTASKTHASGTAAAATGCARCTRVT
jgi:hypothetical protein